MNKERKPKTVEIAGLGLPADEGRDGGRIRDPLGWQR